MRERCAWWETIGPLGPPNPVQGDKDVDAAVIGGGFTGLACARRLAELEPGQAIALIDSTRIGAANSGLNSGFLLDVSFYDDLPPAVQASRNRLQTAGLKDLERLVQTLGIDCDWRPWGNLYGAFIEPELALLDDLATRYSRHGAAVEFWDSERMTEVTGSPVMRRGVFHPGTVLVQPAKLVRGLAANLPPSVTVHEESPVTRYHRKKERYVLETPLGRVSARRLFVCNNGGAPELGFGRSRLVPVTTFAAVTQPLSGLDRLLDTIEPFGMLPTLTGGPTIRMLPECRFLVRSDFVFTRNRVPTKTETERFVMNAKENLERRWPSLRHYRWAFEHVWHGVMSLTRNTASVFGRMDDGVYVSAFCNGAGNTAGSSAGRLLAELDFGRESDLLADQLSLPQPTWVPPDFLLAPYVSREIARTTKALRRIYG
ncbi:MAG: FAD-dependent oxidoreductase [Rhodospirillales bacterium]